MHTYQYLVLAFCLLGHLASASLDHRFRSRTASLTRHQQSIRNRADPKGEAGSIGAMYMCTDVSFTGECSYVKPAMGSCYSLPTPFRCNIASFGPDQYGGAETFKFGCRVYSSDDCTGANVRYAWPGVSNGKLYIQARSVKCEFYDPDALETYKEWIRQGYEFDRP